MVSAPSPNAYSVTYPHSRLPGRLPPCLPLSTGHCRVHYMPSIRRNFLACLQHSARYCCVWGSRALRQKLSDPPHRGHLRRNLVATRCKCGDLLCSSNNATPSPPKYPMFYFCPVRWSRCQCRGASIVPRLWPKIRPLFPHTPSCFVSQSSLFPGPASAMRRVPGAEMEPAPEHKPQPPREGSRPPAPYTPSPVTNQSRARISGPVHRGTCRHPKKHGSTLREIVFSFDSAEFRRCIMPLMRNTRGPPRASAQFLAISRRSYARWASCRFLSRSHDGLAGGVQKSSRDTVQKQGHLVEAPSASVPTPHSRRQTQSHGGPEGTKTAVG
ncbi:unnamed protein product [Trichogramma brassicae]|uniref:Uncharacterized protein n=1 Tax=Trichogramma brassicae TaxID=86971 RepID=A0A6H5HX64_9HYME|nr:unnamed protein product [Trichogramma brassicae]